MTATRTKRQVILVRENNHGLREERRVRMRDLVMGDFFRIETDDPEDHLFGSREVFEALSEPYKEKDVWGIDVRIEE